MRHRGQSTILKDENQMTKIAAAVFCLLLASCGGGGQGNTYKDYDCSVFPDQFTSPYILPYQIGKSFKAFPHAARTASSTNSINPIQYYSLDIEMPIGTEIVASRDGEVILAEEQFSDSDHTPGNENVIIVLHDDGTFARYFHLTKNGALVNVGDRVNQLDVIGLSGNSGNSTGPHLHFDVMEVVGGDGEFCVPQRFTNSDPRHCTTVPLSFLNSPVTDCGLRFGVSYEAFSF